MTTAAWSLFCFAVGWFVGTYQEFRWERLQKFVTSYPSKRAMTRLAHQSPNGLLTFVKSTGVFEDWLACEYFERLVGDCPALDIACPTCRSPANVQCANSTSFDHVHQTRFIASPSCQFRLALSFARPEQTHVLLQLLVRFRLMELEGCEARVLSEVAAELDRG